MAKTKTLILPKVERPRPPHFFSAVRTFMWRAFQQIKHSWVSLSFGDILMPVVIMLVFTYFFGGALSDSPQHYLDYLLPGILLLTVVPMTLTVAVSISKDITKGIFDRFRTLPFSQSASLYGVLIVHTLRYVIALLVMACVGLLLGFRAELGGMLLAIAIIAVFGFSISWIFAAIGIRSKNPDVVLSGASMVVYPLIFASNVFVDTHTMPSWLQAIITVNPISIVASAARNLAAGNMNIPDIGWALGVCGVCLAVFIPVTLTLYNRKQ